MDLASDIHLGMQRRANARGTSPQGSKYSIFYVLHVISKESTNLRDYLQEAEFLPRGAFAMDELVSYNLATCFFSIDDT